MTTGLAAPAFAEQEKASSETQISNLRPSLLATTEQARPNANGQVENRYLWPAVILMSVGGLVTLYGMTHETGVACSTASTSVSCGVTKSKGTMLAGVGMVGVGAFLFYKGKSQPHVVFGPRLVGVRQQFTW